MVERSRHPWLCCARRHEPPPSAGDVPWSTEPGAVPPEQNIERRGGHGSGGPEATTSENQNRPSAQMEGRCVGMRNVESDSMYHAPPLKTRSSDVNTGAWPVAFVKGG